MGVPVPAPSSSSGEGGASYAGCVVVVVVSTTTVGSTLISWCDEYCDGSSLIVDSEMSDGIG